MRLSKRSGNPPLGPVTPITNRPYLIVSTQGGKPCVVATVLADTAEQAHQRYTHDHPTTVITKVVLDRHPLAGREGDAPEDLDHPFYPYVYVQLFDRSYSASQIFMEASRALKAAGVDELDRQRFAQRFQKVRHDARAAAILVSGWVGTDDYSYGD